MRVFSHDWLPRSESLLLLKLLKLLLLLLLLLPGYMFVRRIPNNLINMEMKMKFKMKNRHGVKRGNMSEHDVMIPFVTISFVEGLFFFVHEGLVSYP